MGSLIPYSDLMHGILAVVVHALSPHISPASCCGQRCTAPSGVSRLGVLDVLSSTRSAPLRSKTPLGAAPRRPRDETR